MELPTPHSRSQSLKGPRIVRWAILVGIVVALNIFILVGRTFFLVEPDHEKFCPNSLYANVPTTQQACSATGGAWNPQAPIPPPSKINGQNVPLGFCDVTAKCQKAYDAAHDQFALYAFILGIAVGIIAIIVGVLPLGSSIVSAGFSYGGVLSLVISSAQYWGQASSYLRLGISFIALVVLIYIGIKYFKDN
jgi:hypothetical protein